MVCGRHDAPGGQSAFAKLCQLYWVPLHAFVHRKGYSTHDAENLIQGFFLHVLETGALVLDLPFSSSAVISPSMVKLLVFSDLMESTRTG